MVEKMNDYESVYLSGSPTTDGSVRFSIDPDTNYTIVQERVLGVWQPGSLEIGSNTLRIGKNVAIGGVGHHVVTESGDNHFHLLAHNEFDGETTTEDTTILNAYSFTERLIYQPDESGSFTGQLLEYSFPATTHLLAKRIYHKTDTTAATEPVRIQIWIGTNDTGSMIFDQTMPDSKFSASSEVYYDANGYVEYDAGTTYFLRYSSDADFSLKMETTNTIPWLAADTSLVREDNLLQTMPWENNTSYPVGQYLINNRTIMVSNDSSVQTGSFESNLDKWANIASQAAMNFWTKVGNVLSFSGDVEVGGDITTNGSLFQPVYGSDDGLVLYAPLSETGSTQYDRSPYGNDGAVTGATCNSTNGKYGNGCYFDGDDKIDIVYDASLNPDVFTVSVWAKVDGGAGTYRSPITSRDAPIEKGYTLYASDTNIWEFWMGRSTTWSKIYGPAVVLGEWTLVTATYNGTTQHLYVNGVLANSSTSTYTPNTLYPTRIGAGITEGEGSFYFNGSIDEVKIYSRALSEDEIRTHYLRGSGANGVIVADKFRIVNTTNTIVLEVNSTGLVLNEGSFVGNGSELTGLNKYNDTSDIFWNRNGTDLIPKNSGDDVVLIGDIIATFLRLNGETIYGQTSLALFDGTRNRIEFNPSDTELYSPNGNTTLFLGDDSFIFSTPNDASELDLSGNLFQFVMNSVGRIAATPIYTRIISPDGSEIVSVNNTGTTITGNLTVSELINGLSLSSNKIETSNSILDLNVDGRARLEISPLESELISPDGDSSVWVENNSVQLVRDGNTAVMANPNGVTLYSPDVQHRIVVDNDEIEILGSQLRVNDGVNDRMGINPAMTFLQDEQSTNPARVILGGGSFSVTDGLQTRFSIDSTDIYLNDNSGNAKIHIHPTSTEIHYDGGATGYFQDTDHIHLFSPNGANQFHVGDDNIYIDSSTGIDLVGPTSIDGDLSITGSLYLPDFQDEANLIIDLTFEHYGTDVIQYSKGIYDNIFTSTGDVVTQPTSGPYNGPMAYFDGIDGVMKTDDVNGFNMSTNELLTVEVWAKSTDIAGGHYIWAITGTHASVWESFILQPTGANQVGVYFGDGSDAAQREMLATVNDVTEWHQYDVTLDRINNIMQIYVDGELKNTEDISAEPASYTTPIKVGLGAFAHGDAFWKGDLARFHIYNKVLSATEVKAHHSRSGGESVIKADTFRIIDTDNNLNFQVNKSGDVEIRNDLNIGGDLSVSSTITSLSNSLNLNDGTRDRIKIKSTATELWDEDGDSYLSIGNSNLLFTDGTEYRIVSDTTETKLYSPSSFITAAITNLGNIFTGNVGIGMFDPDAPLEVTTSNSSDEAVLFKLSSQKDRPLSILQPDGNSNPFIIATNNALTFRIDDIDSIILAESGSTSINDVNRARGIFDTVDSRFVSPDGDLIMKVNNVGAYIIDGIRTRISVVESGNLDITSANGGTILTVSDNDVYITSTTGAFYPPSMTTTQRNNLIGVSGGAEIYNTDINKHQGYNGTAWNNFY